MVVNFFNSMRLRTKLSLLIGILFIVPLLLVGILLNNFIAKEYYSISGERVIAVARFVASYPRVVTALATPGSVPIEELSQILDDLAAVAQVRYIVPMNMRAERLYHPNREKIGFHFSGGDEGRALQGETYYSTVSFGAPGFSQRGFVPVYGPGGEQIGAVSVGIMSGAIENIIAKVVAPVKKLLFVSLLAGLLLALLLARSIKKILFGLEPGEIATLLQERSAMLQMVDEGVIAVDLDGHATLVNDKARRILDKAGIKRTLPGKPLADSVPEEKLLTVMKSGVPRYGDEQTLGGVAILANYMPLAINNTVAGAIATFKDMSEVRQLAERITDVNKYIDALRSQSHEFTNKLHVIMGLLDSGKQDELRAYVRQQVDRRTVEDKAIPDVIQDPVIAGFLSSKHSNARELGVAVVFESEGVLPPISGSALQQSLVTILGNLIDNALDAVQDSPVKELRMRFLVTPDSLAIAVSDTGAGLDDTAIARVFEKGYSTKGENRGLGLWLVAKATEDMGGSVNVFSHPGSGSVFRLSLPLSGLAGEVPC